MKILGVSGLGRSVPFKRAHWPGLDEREYRISQGHDAAAALVLAIGRLIEDGSFREESGRISRERAVQFSWEKNAETAERIYKSILPK